MRPFWWQLGLTINDQLFATVIGASFVAVLSLMAWIVKTLATLDAKVEYFGERIARLESSNGQSSRRK